MSSKVGEGPLYSIQGKYSTLKINEVPVSSSQGPGSYSQSSKLHHSPQYRIGTASRSTDHRQDSPGPGAYDSNQRGGGPQWGFGSQPKARLQESSTPGPGSYQIPSQRDSKAFSMSAKHAEAGRHDSPGPGAYSPSKSLDAPLFSMGRSKRSPWRESDVPGPGSYFVSREVNYSTNLQGGTGMRRPLSAGHSSHGPGAYEGRSMSVGSGISFKFGSSNRPQTSNSQSPGPGNYSPVRRASGPSFSMRPKTAHDRSSEVPVSFR